MVRPQALLAPHEATTFFYERWRAFGAGILDSSGMTFLMLIAVSHFQADYLAKGILGTGGGAGLLLGPVAVYVVRRMNWPAARGASAYAFCGGLSFLVAALFPILPIFIMGSVLGLVFSALSLPFVTQITQDNYPREHRGQLFSRTVVIRIAAEVCFSAGAGWYFSDDTQQFPGLMPIHAQADRLNQFPWLMLIYALAMFGASFCFSRVPSQPITSEREVTIWEGLRVVREDKLFRHTLICWMLMGIGNLMMLSLRIEYLANPKYGLALHITAIVLLTSVLPNAARFCMTRLWGRLFDRMNFFLLRAVLNMSFALAIVTFYTGSSMPGLICGALIFGVSTAGGEVAWALWVTKFSPPDRVAEYMAVHTSLTGFRQLLAPLLAFSLLRYFTVGDLAVASFVLICISAAMLIPEFRTRTANQNSEPMPDEGVED